MSIAAPSIRINAAWMFAGTGVYALCQWMIAIVLARLGGSEAVGLFAFGSAISMPVVVASQLALRQVLLADTRKRYAFSDYFTLRSGATIGALVAIASIAVALGYRGESLVAIVGIAVGRCCESISDIHYARLQQSERLAQVARFTMLRG